jgi:two-component system, LytTR family, sensor kinase
MNNRYKIAISLSLAMAAFYSLPWIALSEQPHTTRVMNSAAVTRISYLFVTVFVTGIFFFQYNFFWKHKLLIIKNPTLRQLANLFLNVLLVFLLSCVLIMISNGFFNIGTGRIFFIFYLFRNIGIALIVMLVTYVVELTEKSRQDKIEMLILRNQNSETELAALRSQIDPHFLFNSLASLSGLIRANSKEALAFVNHLTETFRYILEKRENKLVTVKDEIKFLES